MRRLAITIITLLTAFGTPAVLWAGPFGLDDFENGTTMQWEIGNPALHPAPPANIPNGGPAGVGDAYLRLTSDGSAGPGGRLSVFNVSQWTGDYLAAGLTGIEMDVNNFGTTDLFLRALLVNFPGAPGPPTDVAWTLDAVIVPAGSGWMHVRFDLRPTNLFAPVGSALGALGAVDELRLFHNPAPAFGGPMVGAPPIVASLGIDNIVASVPEPSTWLLMGSGLFALALVRRRRRHGQT